MRTAQLHIPWSCLEGQLIGSKTAGKAERERECTPEEGSPPAWPWADCRQGKRA